jgi:Zn-dependent protease with chaperone function
LNMHKLVQGVLGIGVWLSLSLITLASPTSFGLSLPYRRRSVALPYSFDEIVEMATPFVMGLLGMVAIWIVGAIILGIIGKIYSDRTLRMVDKINAMTRTTPQEAKLRAQYATLINVAAFYYYFTLPAVASVMILTAVGVLYAFLWIGWVPLKLLVIGTVGLLLGLFNMLASLFARPRKGHEGRVLKAQEAPGLFRLVYEVAQTIGTRPVNEIRLTHGTDCCVYEDGTPQQTAQDKAKRVLVLGVALIPGMKLNALRAVLAHEYGHFVHRDTAGGEVALRMQLRLRAFILALFRDGHSENSVAVRTVSLYLSIFNRISHGASRLQEILADRVAVACYGAAAFQEGLTHIVRRSLEFDEAAEVRLHTATFYNGQAENLYGADLHNTAQTSPELAQALQAELTRPTTSQDSHPSPAERFKLAARIPCRRPLPADGMAWDLFEDHGQLFSDLSRQAQREMDRAMQAARFGNESF